MLTKVCIACKWFTFQVGSLIGDEDLLSEHLLLKLIDKDNMLRL